MRRADHDPAQAEAQMQVLQDEAGRIDSLKDEAQELVDDLERKMNAAHEAGNDSEVAELQKQHQLAEQNLEVAEQEFESVMDQIGQSTQFWYVDDEI
ncbi:hypothetical protein [Glutamicibacter sp. AOP5-A2-18]|uniref:hypothetical protein n=1 Tax=Glutamicibacter sp. AOP5-A2-18 TaxID=3457656 RepID=UPI0040333D2F